MTRDRRLGRGLEALLSQPMQESGDQASEHHDTGGHDSTGGDQGLVWVNVYEIDRNPFQPRQYFNDEEIRTLGESITEHGMLQPVIVRRHHDRFQLVSGERRWRAATVAGWEKVPAQIWDADDRRMSELAIIENVQRKDLGPLEKATSFQRYLEQYQCTQEELAARVNVDRSTIANLIRLLDLPEPVQDAIREGTISQGHARALLPLGDHREQVAFVRRIQEEQLSVRATEQLVQEAVAAADGEAPLGVVGHEPASRTPRARNEHLASLAQEFRTSLGTKVDIRQGTKGRGKIVIHFTSHEEFDRLRADLTGRGNQNRTQAG